jgi:hypothetical protein
MVRNLPLPELVDESLDPYVESRRSGIVRIPVSWEPIEVALEKEQEFIPSD